MFAYRKLVIKFSYLESNSVGKNRVRIIFPNYIKKNRFVKSLLQEHGD